MDELTSRSVSHAEGQVLGRLSQSAVHDRPKGRQFWAANLANTARKGVNNPHLYRYLSCKYGHHPLLQRYGRLYPVAIFSPPKKQVSDVDSVLVDLQDTGPHDDELWPRDAKFRELWARTLQRGHLQDLPTYAMKGLVATEDRLGVSCERGTYFRALE